MTYSMQSQKLWGVSLLLAALSGCGGASSDDDSASHQPELGTGDESTGASNETASMPTSASTDEATPAGSEMQPADPEQQTPASSAPTSDDTVPEEPQLFESEPPLDAPPGSWAILDIDPVECQPRRARLGAVASPDDFASSDANEQTALHSLEMDYSAMFRHPTYATISGEAGLEHDVTFTREALDALLAGISVSVISEMGGSLRCPHTHRVTVHACQSNLLP